MAHRGGGDKRMDDAVAMNGVCGSPYLTSIPDA